MASFLASLFLFFGHASTVQADDKVAIFVVGEDHGGMTGLPEYWQSKGADLYKKLGYKIVVVGGGRNGNERLTSESFNKALNQARDAKDVRIDFIGHGVLREAAPGTEHLLKMSPERTRNLSGLKLSSSQIVWAPYDGELRDLHPKLSNVLEIASKEKLLDSSDIKNSLRQFHNKNPNAVTSINLLNCFSGALATDLRREPNTIVFGSSPSTETSNINVDTFERSSSALSHYYDLLKSNPGDMLSSHQQANRSFKLQILSGKLRKANSSFKTRSRHWMKRGNSRFQT